jgi:serine/threonine-protein kinase
MDSEVDPRRWIEVLAAFEELVELPEALREERLHAIGASDPRLRGDIEHLLANDREVESRLGRIEHLFESSGSSETGDPGALDLLGLVGRTVSHFRVEAPLARGGMGVLYRAKDLELGRFVALKFPLPTEEVDRTAKERFLREARLTSALDHPNVCAIYEAGETADGRLFYAMPLYQGETLKARIVRDGCLPVADALAIARQITEAVGAAHRLGIIHRDLKPANVMLLPDSTVKVLDFGLARAADPSLTASRSTLGTVAYMAPEQILGHTVDGRVDLWALGVVLFEMLTGRRPFEGEQEAAVAHAILFADPGRASALRPGLPTGSDELVLRLLCKDQGRRFASAEQVIAALDKAARGGAHTQPTATRSPVTGPPEPAPRSAPVRRRRQWSRRSRAGVITVAATTIVVAGGGALVALRDPALSERSRAIAVIPFEYASLSGDAPHIAIGLSDAIASELSRIPRAIVPGYLATSRFGGTTEPWGRVAAELGVTALLTGVVQEVEDRLLIHTTLVEPGAGGSGDRLLERTYEAAFADLPNLPLQIARAVTDALDLPLVPEERTRLARRVTSSAPAYSLYLRARSLELADLKRTLFPAGGDNLREQQSLYSRARHLDPNFAEARARLAIVLMRGASTDTTHARREQARLEAESALRLHPGLPDAHYALGSYWAWERRELSRAIEEYRLALDAAPSRTDLRVALGRTYVNLGRLEDGVAEFERAMELDPGNPQASTLAGLILVRLRRDDEGIRAINRSIELMPDDHNMKLIKGHTYLRRDGTTDSLQAILREIPPDWDANGMATFARYTAIRVERRFADGLAMLDESPSELSRDGLVYHPKALMRAEMYHGLGDRERAAAEYEVARATLTRDLAANPTNPSIRAALALAYAGLGRREEAVAEAKAAITAVPLSRGSTSTTAFMGLAAEVYARVGKHDAAFEMIELLLSMPAGREVTIPFLRVWPGFDPLRADPRFEQVLERFPGADPARARSSPTRPAAVVPARRRAPGAT